MYEDDCHVLEASTIGNNQHCILFHLLQRKMVGGNGLKMPITCGGAVDAPLMPRSNPNREFFIFNIEPPEIQGRSSVPNSEVRTINNKSGVPP